MTATVSRAGQTVNGSLILADGFRISFTGRTVVLAPLRIHFPMQ